MVSRIARGRRRGALGVDVLSVTLLLLGHDHGGHEGGHPPGRGPLLLPRCGCSLRVRYSSPSPSGTAGEKMCAVA
jgi:hypothetical protein